MGSPFLGLHSTLVNLKGQCQDHSDFEGLYLVKESGHTPVGNRVLGVQYHHHI